MTRPFEPSPNPIVAKAAPETEFKIIEHVIFQLEEKFPGTSVVRRALFKARCEVGKAAEINRVRKDWPQEDWVYE